MVCGAGGYDELTTMGVAALHFVAKGATWPGSLDPAEYGFAPCEEEALAVSGPEEAEKALRALLTGQGPKAMADMLALNLGFALYLLRNSGEEAADRDPQCGYNRERMTAAMREAKEAVAQGAGRSFVHA